MQTQLMVQQALKTMAGVREGPEALAIAQQQCLNQLAQSQTSSKDAALLNDMFDKVCTLYAVYCNALTVVQIICMC